MLMTNYKFNLRRSPVDERDFLLSTVYPADVTLPEVYDLRPEMPAVRDQGTQGTCSAQTAAAMKDWQERVDVGFQGYMSPQFVYNLRESYGMEGMTPRDTMKILNKVGIVPEKHYPYGKLEDLNEETLNAELRDEASKYKIAGYARIDLLDGLKKALFANGPCYIAFPVYNPEKMEFWKPDFTGQQMIGGHAVCVAGWLKDSFIIRNSWSTAWGDKGYTYLKFSDWGSQWEAWTTIDADSTPENLEKKAAAQKCTKGLFARLFKKNLQR
jgi:C1A family cysteine protease